MHDTCLVTLHAAVHFVVLWALAIILPESFGSTAKLDNTMCNSVMLSFYRFKNLSSHCDKPVGDVSQGTMQELHQKQTITIADKKQDNVTMFDKDTQGGWNNISKLFAFCLGLKACRLTQCVSYKSHLCSSQSMSPPRCAPPNRAMTVTTWYWIKEYPWGT